MKILIDINHPAHVHYFRNFIKLMEEKGHVILIIARNKDITFQLLKLYQIKYNSRGNGGKGYLSKFLYLFYAVFFIVSEAFRFKPDLFLSFGSVYASIASFFINKPHIAFEDTEHSKLDHFLYLPFTNVVLTPKEFKKDFGKKHIKFDSSMDMAYLHAKNFTPNPQVLEIVNVQNNEKIYFVRFVSWSANHDVGYKGFSSSGKLKLIKLLSDKGKVFISSETNLPKNLKKYELNIPPSMVHDLLYYSDLFVGESGTMATEAATLGIPSVIVNSSAKLFGVFDRFLKNDLLVAYEKEEKAFNKINEIIISNYKRKIEKQAHKLMKHSIDLTAFMVWFVEKYPKSFTVLQNNPDYQFNFV